MIRIFFFLLLLTGSLHTYAQKLLKGMLIDEKGTAVPKASVFLNNTSIGTTADDNGNFSLFIPQGKFDLIVSSIGFVTANQAINAAEMADFITIKLLIKAPEMESIIIEPFLKDGWKQWGNFFLKNFLGQSSLADDCNLLNKEVLRFSESKKNNELTAIATEPLVIENKALGYSIRYQLESFNYNTQNHYLLFTGYPFFEKMEGSPRQLARWEKARQEAYYGSQLHFMRSIYLNTVVPEGFRVHRLKRIINTEKQRVKALFAGRVMLVTEGNTGRQVRVKRNSDSTNYYNSILDEPDYKEVVEPNMLSGDSIAFAIDSVTAGLGFTDYLLIIYSRKKVRPEYLRQFPRSNSAMVSQLFLLNQNLIQIQSNGMYFNPADLLTLGYWAWSEKISAMLPYDYKPPN